MKGELFEIDSNKILVWEYNSPVSNAGITTQGQAFTGQGSSIFRSYRYEPMFLGFVRKTLTPTVPIELLPNTSHCSVPTSINPSQNQTQGVLKLYPNPAKSKITLKTTAELIGKPIMIYNLLGQLMYSQPITINLTDINITSLAKGTYILNISHRHTQQIIIL